MKKKYKLKTIKDIADNIPLSRIKDCMKELTSLMMQVKSVEVGAKAFAQIVTGDSNNAKTVFPDEITWVDDNKGEVQTNIIINDKKAFKIKEQMES